MVDVRDYEEEEDSEDPFHLGLARFKRDRTSTLNTMYKFGENSEADAKYARDHQDPVLAKMARILFHIPIKAWNVMSDSKQDSYIGKLPSKKREKLDLLKVIPIACPDCEQSVRWIRNDTEVQCTACAYNKKAKNYSEEEFRKIVGTLRKCIEALNKSLG